MMFCRLSAVAITLCGMMVSNLAANQADTAQPDRDQMASAGLVLADSTHTAAAKPSDKELIAKQKTCPVTDQPLGSMGEPVKMKVKGRTVFLCCAGCKKKLLADPDKYLKKLDGKK